MKAKSKFYAVLIGSLALFAVLYYVGKASHLITDEKLEQIKLLNKQSDSLLVENTKLQSKYDSLQIFADSISKNVGKIKESIKTVYVKDFTDLEKLPQDSLAKMVDSTFAKSKIYIPKVTKTEVTNNKTLIIDPLIGIDYILATKSSNLKDSLVNELESKSLVMQNQNDLLKNVIKNDSLVIKNEKQVSGSYKELFENERKGKKLTKSVMYGALTSTALYSFNTKPSIALPSGLVVAIGNFLFN